MLESGETLEQPVIREVREATGLQAKPPSVQLERILMPETAAILAARSWA